MLAGSYLTGFNHRRRCTFITVHACGGGGGERESGEQEVGVGVHVKREEPFNKGSPGAPHHWADRVWLPTRQQVHHTRSGCRMAVRATRMWAMMSTVLRPTMKSCVLWGGRGGGGGGGKRVSHVGRACRV